ncbi:phosphotransferase [Dasania sp. GY-MA-18]|uniref:Phosphotransferase n=1 Tax=Dasania phycosphaerae TaxID=2950436 RepID=A0A9J6RKK8_9GAMM|nr:MULTISPECIES: phosphotransferase [Dasania]MCR8922332.1 phosphotransferase [Dasania sp. GY-MA-18]MCZ0864760.1 phosphotransferase [Dasania phycosphaerae]MCZ0868488.1 phosphotransferase [Dasania phycosphaerae]
MQSVLITQCLQNDFVKPLNAGDPLPNQLHIGHEESQRLVGESIATGPVGRFMAWVNSQTSNQLATIHIRDWHAPDCPEQASHLKQFNSHCLQNTAGADFIFSETESTNKEVTVIDSTTLNDFEGTALKQTLDNLASRAPADEKLRIGIIGVWTEAKVLFLAYELATRYPHCEIAVCSALTASSSRSQHFLALQQLDRIVGITVIDSIGEFTQYLGGEETPTQHQSLNKSIEIVADGDMLLDDETEFLIRHLFRDCQRISLKILDGGFSGNLVAGVNSIDIHGHEQTPHVIKIGPRAEMAKERTSFEQIENVMGNNAPAIADYADSQHKGAIKYRYASMGSGSARSLQSCFQKGASQEKLRSYLDAVFNEQLGRLYRAATNDTQDLLVYYCFDSHWAGSVKNKIEELIGHCPEQGELTLPGNKKAYNLYQFYKEDLDQLPSMVGDYPFAFVHGDLNGANVIIDERGNVWLIDFFHTHRGHVLKDFAKLENDLLYIYTPIESEEDLIKAYAFSDFLLSFEHPFENLPALPDEFKGTQFEKTYASICHIRKLAGQYIDKSDKSTQAQWLIPQLRYAVHTIGFDEPNKKQRIWALYTATSSANNFNH